MVRGRKNNIEVMAFEIHIIYNGNTSINVITQSLDKLINSFKSLITLWHTDKIDFNKTITATTSC